MSEDQGAAHVAESPTEARRTAAQWLAQIGVELGIGLVLAVVLLIVAWGSSNAIHFVYGGY